MSSPLLRGAPIFVDETRSVINAAANAVIALAKQGKLRVLVVSGGATTPLVLRQIALLWTFNHTPTLMVSDERHSEIFGELNVTRLRDSLKSTVLAQARIVSPTYQPDLAESASEWSRELASLPTPNAAILSMADDGHIASLFPGVTSEVVSDSVEICRTSPKPPEERISLSSAYLRKIPHRMAVVVGTNKTASLQAVAAGSELPISDFMPTRWFVDSSAYIGLRHE